MKLRREPLTWLIFFAATATAALLLVRHLQPSGSSASFIRYLIEAAPAASAALALPSLFLLFRFLMNGQPSPSPPSRSRHVIAAIFVSLAGISTWEASQMFLQGTPLSFPFFAGALAGSLLFWLFWLLAKNWLRNSHHASPPAGT